MSIYHRIIRESARKDHTSRTNTLAYLICLPRAGETDGGIDALRGLLTIVSQFLFQLAVPHTPGYSCASHIHDF